MPTQTATPLPRRHALSAPVFTMHTARATLRGHPRRTPGLSCTLPGVTLAIATLPACERSRRHSFPMTNSPPRIGRRVLCVLPTACLPSGSSLVHRALCISTLISSPHACAASRSHAHQQMPATMTMSSYTPSSSDDESDGGDPMVQPTKEIALARTAMPPLLPVKQTQKRGQWEQGTRMNLDDSMCCVRSEAPHISPIPHTPTAYHTKCQ